MAASSESITIWPLRCIILSFLLIHAHLYFYKCTYWQYRLKSPSLFIWFSSAFRSTHVIHHFDHTQCHCSNLFSHSAKTRVSCPSAPKNSGSQGRTAPLSVQGRACSALLLLDELYGLKELPARTDDTFLLPSKQTTPTTNLILFL